MTQNVFAPDTAIPAAVSLALKIAEWVANEPRILVIRARDSHCNSEYVYAMMRIVNSVGFECQDCENRRGRIALDDSVMAYQPSQLR